MYINISLLDSMLGGFTPAGIIQVIAGTGYAGNNAAYYSNYHMPATNSPLNHPTHIWGTLIGDIYIADTVNNLIRVYNATTRSLTNIAGYNAVKGYSGDNSRATWAQLNNPMGCFITSSGEGYIGDTHNQRIRKVDRSGIFNLYCTSMLLKLILQPNYHLFREITRYNN
jgi:hypothetical protein